MPAGSVAMMLFDVPAPVRRFTALREIAADSAVVFLSDEAAANQGWQQHVRALPENIRLIPVGTFVSADFSDPGVVPPRIEEINFIRTDERMRENILDSLTTDPSFYSMKNHLMVRYYSWSITAGGTGAGAGSSAAGSTGAGAGKPAGGRGKKRVPMGYEGNLLTDRKEIRRYREAFLRKASGEEDPYLKKQLEGILDYLDVSDRYARKLLLAAILRWTGRGVLFSLVAGIFVLFYRFLVPYYHRASYANISGVYVNASACAHHQKNYSLSLAYIDKAIDYDGASPELFAIKAQLALDAGDMPTAKTAIAVFDRMAKGKESPRSYLDKIKIADSEHNINESMRLGKELVEKYPNSSQAREYMNNEY